VRKRRRVTLAESLKLSNRATWDEFTPDPITPWFVIVLAGFWYWITGVPAPKDKGSALQVDDDV
jgi:hypothetical protein